MIKRKIGEEKGITLITLSVAIIIMIIITSVLLYNANTGTNIRILNNLYQDINLLKDKVDLYYVKYGALPIVDLPYTNIEAIKSLNDNDNQNYYVIDLQTLENVTLKYGKDYVEYKKSKNDLLQDIYVINEQSHNIYYIQGIQFETKMYYTIPGEYTKVEVSTVGTISLLNNSGNEAEVFMKAINPNVGIKIMEVYLNDELYKSFKYDDIKKQVEENVIITNLEFYKVNNCYYKVIDENDQIMQSNIIQIKNETAISTSKDLKNLAKVVNEGNDFTGKTVELMTDIDLEGSEGNQWTPIGTLDTPFKGTFEGNNHTISNIYMNKSDYFASGLFGVIKESTLKNFTLRGNIIASYYGAGIVAYVQNDSLILNCKNYANITQDGTAYVLESGYVIGNSGIAAIAFENSRFEGCINYATIKSNSIAAGIVAYTVKNITITSCANEGNIAGRSKYRWNFRNNRC